MLYNFYDYELSTKKFFSFIRSLLFNNIFISLFMYLVSFVHLFCTCKNCECYFKYLLDHFLCIS